MIERQLQLEREMIDNGIARYNRNRVKAEECGRGSTTSYAQRLLPELVHDLADAVEDAKNHKSGGRMAKYTMLLQGCDANQAAFITLKVIFDGLIKGGTVNNIAVQIGQRIEDQVRFAVFAEEYEDYYAEIVSNFKRKKTVEYRHMRNVMRHVAKDKDGWVDWTPTERLKLGCKLIELVIQHTALVEKTVRYEGSKRTVMRLVPTQDAMDWIEQHIQEASILHPETGPCLMPPCDWVSMNDGGFFTPELRRRVPMVKIKSRAHREALKGADLTKPMAAINKLQKTAWRVNAKVHDVIKEVWRLNLGIGMPDSEPYQVPPCPIPSDLTKEQMDDSQLAEFNLWKRTAALLHTAERERQSKSIQLSRVLSMSQKYRSFEEFYYVYTTDFRGRIYTASPGLTPQGADFSKGLLEFGEGVALGATGFKWLAVHTANTYGFDKSSFSGRVQWCKEHEDIIRRVAADPLDSTSRSFWAGADKPYQFLAACFDYAAALADPTGHVSHLPVAMDGSCNGIQNFSAMLLDSVGGRSTNLLPLDEPSDIYADVAYVCIEKLASLDCNLSKQWLTFGVTRKLTKKPVMTLPYGSTKQSCRESVEDYILTNRATAPWEGVEFRRAATFMSNIIWESISEVVIAARAAMEWLQKSSRVLSKANATITWHTPLGFRVYQGTMKRNSVRVNTQLMGAIQLSLTHDTSEVDKYRQANGIAPNFVHSMDATHLMMTVLHERCESIIAWAMVHDSYGTHAGRVEEMNYGLRAAFTELYDDDILGNLKAELEAGGFTLPDLPDYGDLDINDVMDAEYFFG